MVLSLAGVGRVPLRTIPRNRSAVRVRLELAAQPTRVRVVIANQFALDRLKVVFSPADAVWIGAMSSCIVRRLRFIQRISSIGSQPLVGQDLGIGKTC
jgi:hypothetical protein